MGKPLSVDLRSRIRSYVESGHSRHAAADRFDVSVSAVVKLMTRVDATGSVAPARQGRPPGTGKLAPFSTFLTDQVEAVPDITMPELSEVLLETHNVHATPEALSRFLIREGYSYKKNTGRDRTRAGEGQA